jgi:hypothetical protein
MALSFLQTVVELIWFSRLETAKVVGLFNDVDDVTGMFKGDDDNVTGLFEGDDDTFVGIKTETCLPTFDFKVPFSVTGFLKLDFRTKGVSHSSPPI